jgi:prophage endopeptidase
MNRTEFIVAMTIVLFIAFGLGWFASWLVHRLTRVTQAEMSDLDQMARDLHDAEENRDQAAAYLEERERDLSAQLAQTKAELDAAMEGLREARSEAGELRAYIEKVSSA